MTCLCDGRRDARSLRTSICSKMDQKVGGSSRVSNERSTNSLENARTAIRTHHDDIVQILQNGTRDGPLKARVQTHHGAGKCLIQRERSLLEGLVQHDGSESPPAVTAEKKKTLHLDVSWVLKGNMCFCPWVPHDECEFPRSSRKRRRRLIQVDNDRRSAGSQGSISEARRRVTCPCGNPPLHRWVGRPHAAE
jgi:hypothetical protein